MGSARGGEERPEGGAKGLEVAVIAAKARLTANMDRERKLERATEETAKQKTQCLDIPCSYKFKSTSASVTLLLHPSSPIFGQEN